MPADDFVLQLALRKGLVNETQLAQARATAAAHGGRGAPPRVLEVLAAEQGLTPHAVVQLLAEEFGLPVVEPDTVQAPADVLALVPQTLAQRHGILPLARAGRTLRVAVSDPLDTDPLDRLGQRLQLDIRPALAPAAGIAAAIARIYGADTEAPAAAVAVAAGPRSAAAAGVREAGTAYGAESENAEADAPIIRLVHDLMAEAVRRRASDIHLEPLEKRFRVRYRIDGVLTEAADPPRPAQLATISRLKIMANISIAEKRIPQDGRIQLALDGRTLDLRVSSLPTVHGESIVMRILAAENLRPGLPELGLFPDDQAAVERLISRSEGLLLVTGPTGSGKTTTLYSCLHQLNQPDRKIITVEDPVEYQLSGVNQVPVRPDVGMTFAAALRAMLRQAPDIVMIGEIRDAETAAIAINASLTGHLVFSTLHTNDAPGAVTRLIDLGVKPFLVSTALQAAVAQRLVRKICLNCARPCVPAPAELQALALTPERLDGATFRRGDGCPACGGAGYRGRLGLFELLVVNEELRNLIYERAPAARLRARARAGGLRTLREDGARKVTAGLTTVGEVVSITLGDRS
jgi:general secretion pathway protein E/type IV pilus assembly protein PilB